VRRFIRKVGLDNISNLFTSAWRTARETAPARPPAPIERLKKRIDAVIEQENAFSVRDLVINGNDIMEEFDLRPGPIIGKILNELLEMVLDNPELNERRN